jgi:sugar/nucleoside kinase (ribokinase family)/DNA-binding PadR family transcriptional regulator
MVDIEQNEYLWPYLLFLPSIRETRDEFIRTVMASRVARSVFSSFSESGQVLQRDLIEHLPHSNKSILSYLKALQHFGLITTSTTVHNGKRVVIHELTKSGWGLARFFFEGLPSDIEELTAFLLEDYLTRLTTLYKELGIPESRLFDIFARTRARAILEGSKKHTQPAAVLFGAASYNTRIECSKMPPIGGLASCSSPLRSPGGSTAELALAMAAAGFETSLVSSVGNDLEGWEIINQLIQGDVDVANVVVEHDKSTSESIIIAEKADSRMLVGVSPATALSIDSASQVPWKIVESAKVVYIGELFVEVAASVAAYAKAHEIPVVYRCSVPFWNMGLSRLAPVLNQVDILIISRQAWYHLKRIMSPRPIQEIRKVTDAAIVIRETKNRYRLLVAGKQDLIIQATEKVDEVTRWFFVGLLRRIAEGSSIRDCVEHGVKFEKQQTRTA